MGKEYEKRVNVGSTVGAPLGPALFDDFEGVFAWDSDADAADGLIAIDTINVVEGTTSLKISTGTASIIDDGTSASRNLPMRPQKLVKMQAVFLNSPGGELPDVRLRLWAYKDSDLIQGEISFLAETGVLSYVDSALADQDLVISNAKIRGGETYELEFIMDVVNQKYVSARVNNIVVDISDKALWVTTNTDNQSQLIPTIEIRATVAQDTVQYVDKVLVDWLDI